MSDIDDDELPFVASDFEQDVESDEPLQQEAAVASAPAAVAAPQAAKPKPQKQQLAPAPALPVSATAAGGAAARAELIDVLTGGRGLTHPQQALVNAVQVGFGLGDGDPFWLVVLPTLLQNSDNTDSVSEIRELIAAGMQQGKSREISEALETVGESQRETAHAINAMTNRLKVQVERAVEAAIAKIGEDQDKGNGASKIDSNEIARTVAGAVLPRLLPVRLAWTATAIAFVGAVSFAGGVFLNKSGYEKLVLQLEGKIQVYEQALQAKGAKK